MPTNPGDMRPRLNDAFGKVIRTANADWVISGLHTGTRYELFGWDAFEGQYMVFDSHLRSFITLSALYEQLPSNRQQAIWRKHARR